MVPASEQLALDVVVPVFDEQESLDQSIRTLHAYLARTIDHPWCITIADNASTDATGEIADRLARDLEHVGVIHLAEKGRGRALKRAWLTSTADVLAYVDVDLSTQLDALPPLIAPLLSGHSDVAIGTRLAPTARVVRGARREFISRSYNLLLRRTMAVGFSDAQCGFKAIRRDVAAQVLPLVEDDGWFFDTELLIIAERSGLRIHEVPVDWIDDPMSSVDIASTARDDIRGLIRVARSLITGRIPVETIYAALGRAPLEVPPPSSFVTQVVRFGVVGVLSTAVFAVLYLGLSAAMPAQAANFLALLITAVANTWANRRFTFGVRGRPGATRHHLQGLAIFGLAWVITSGSLVGLHATFPEAGAHIEIAVLTVANLVATALRFVLLRSWVFRRGRLSTPKPLTVPITTVRSSSVPHLSDQKATTP